MQSRLNYIIESISRQNIIHGKKLQKNLNHPDADFIVRAEEFLKQYEETLAQSGQTLDYAVTCYLQFLADVSYESVRFIESGSYSSQSFEEVKQRVYSNPGVMTYYMHALLLRQFLLPQNYQLLMFFRGIISRYSMGINTYLEVGAGHGLFISEAMSILGSKASFDLLDISRSALDMSKQFIGEDKAHFIMSDIFEYNPEDRYDFICMGEVLEHVEDPVALLLKLKSLLSPKGILFITTVTNAPAIDHIYLFRDADEIRDVIKKAGLKVVDELCLWSEDMAPEKAERLQVAMMYGGVISTKY